MSELAARRQPRNVRLRRLATVLRGLRTEAGLTRDRAAEHARLDSTTLYRIETARVRPLRITLHTLLDLYGVDDAAIRAELEALLTKSADRPAWLQEAESGLPEDYAALIAFEEDARRVTNVETTLVPGLLQTEDYARASISGILPHIAPDGVERRVKVRMQRQQLLQQPRSLELWAIIDESVLRREVGGPAVMAGQLAHLAAAASWPNVTLQVIPFGCGAHPGMHGAAAILEFSDPADPALVYVEHATAAMFLERATDVSRYLEIAEDLRAAALTPAASLRFVQDLAETIERG